MIISDGKIIEATEAELYRYYVHRRLENIYGFPDYVSLMKIAGVKIVDETKEEVHDEHLQTR